MTEINTFITAKQYCDKGDELESTVRIRYSRLMKKKPELFVHPWRVGMPLTTEQCEALDAAKKRIGGAAKKFNPEALKPEPPKEIPPQKPEPPKEIPEPEVVKVIEANPVQAAPPKNWVQIISLVASFLLPTIASMSNTYNVSHYLSNSVETSKAIMLVISGTPLLYMLGKVHRYVYLGVGGTVILVEAFFNLCAVYISLMAGMTFIFGTPTGHCSPFLDTVCRVTNSGHQETAIGLGFVVAGVLAAVQLSSFYELKKRLL